MARQRCRDCKYLENDPEKTALLGTFRCMYLYSFRVESWFACKGFKPKGGKD